MTTYVAAALRRLVAERAQLLCEYCLVHEDYTFFGCEVEHIISEKHGGSTVATNLAYACAFCNRFKGTDLGSLSPRTGQLCRFFNPRTDSWAEHFALDGVAILPLTDVGDVTVRILELNHPDRLLEREALRNVGHFPSAAAAARMTTTP